MSKLNRVLGQLALFFTAVFIIGILFVSVYSAIYLPSIISDFTSGEFNLELNNLGDHHYSWNILSEKATSFGMEEKTIEKVFPTKSTITIDIDVAQVIFHRESREDILVRYSYEKPITSLYDLKFTTDDTDNTLTLKERLKVTGLNLNRSYKHQLDIYVPEDFVPSQLEIHSSLGKLTNESLIPVSETLLIDNEVSTCEFTIDFPIDTLKVNSEVGKVDITATEAISKAELSAEVGALTFTSKKTIQQLDMSSSVGALTYNGEGLVNDLTLNGEVGKVTVHLSKPGESFNIKSNVGAVAVSIDETPENFAIYAKSNVGKVDTDFLITKKESHPYKVTSDVGGLSIN